VFIAGLANFSITGLGPSFTLLSIEAWVSSILIIWMSVVVILSKNDSNRRGSLCCFLAELNNSVCEGVYLLPSVVQYFSHYDDARGDL
jgi:hypothetical protein